ncbi:MAG: acetyl ornithine aminotransferase family protein [Candidatus Sumerlaeaceae bacterium]|nr:acetyl ornithine aminotransferase family protein [Candidatus Sumerlaeaceae bacterium]
MTTTLAPENKAMLPEIKTPLPGPKAKAVVDRDHTIMSPSYTRDYPFVMERGEGCIVWDVDGNSFLDMAAGIAVNSTGHSHPRVVAAIQDQAAKFLHMSGTDFYYDVQVRLAERICKYAPIKGDKKIFFTNSGTEAIEGALKLARHHKHGTQMIAFYGSFHGRTMGSLSLTASKSTQRKGFSPFLGGIFHVNYGESVANIENNVIKRVVDEAGFAALFVEPIQGEGGYIVPSREWLHDLRGLCDKYGILLVADEVQSGMGRTGKMFACDHFGLQPDIICIAKGIASGMPLGAFIARADIMDWKPGQHGTTFGGNPVACAAAHATVDLLEESLMENATQVGGHLKGRLEELQKKVKCISGARGLGLMLAFDVVDASGKPSPEIRNKIVLKAYEHGILILGCGAHAIRVCPPLVISREQADFFVDTLATICREI